MKFNPKLLECLFGYHTYSEKLTVDKHGIPGHLCQVCRRSKHYTNLLGDTVYRRYDGEGNCIYVGFSDGEEHFFDKEGKCIRIRYSNGTECYFDDDENRIYEE